MIDLERALQIWERIYAESFTGQDRAPTIRLRYRRGADWWHENERIDEPGNPEQVDGRQCSEIVDDDGGLIGRFFGFWGMTPEERTFMKECARSLGIRRLQGIHGVYMEPRKELPPHLDKLPSRWNWAHTLILSGQDAETSLYVDRKKVFAFKGVREFGFHPHHVVHGVVTGTEPFKVLQFTCPDQE